MKTPPDLPPEDRDPVTRRQLALLIGTFALGLLIAGTVILGVAFVFFPPATALWGFHV
ncbi:hypothetical protein ACFFLM_22625 [Deinococcus oregonensis]|uniref:Uncharacterized protein n=1 Tax=Deinococcus oregonensis TaxID=1805970 RepID=A0ABV6B4S2_9DEIO